MDIVPYNEQNQDEELLKQNERMKKQQEQNSQLYKNLVKDCKNEDIYSQQFNQKKDENFRKMSNISDFYENEDDEINQNQFQHFRSQLDQEDQNYSSSDCEEQQPGQNQLQQPQQQEQFQLLSKSSLEQEIVNSDQNIQQQFQEPINPSQKLKAEQATEMPIELGNKNIQQNIGIEIKQNISNDNIIKLQKHQNSMSTQPSEQIAYQNSNNLQNSQFSQEGEEQKEQAKDKNTQNEISIEKFNVFNNAKQIVEKKVQGIAIIDIHQLSEKNSFIDQEFRIDPQLSQNLQCKKLKKEIVRSFRLIQSAFVQENTHLKTKNFEKKGFFSQIVSFEQFSVNTATWPFVASFTMNLKIPIYEGETPSFNLFSEQKKTKSHEIFDAFQPNQITLIVQFWKFDQAIQQIFEERIIKQQQELNQNLQPKEINFYHSMRKQSSGSCLEELMNNNNSQQQNFSEKKDTIDSIQLQIHHDTYTESYRDLMNIGEGAFGRVDLYYDFREDRLLAIKTFQEIIVKPKEKEEEIRVVMEGFKNKNQFNDQQIQGETKLQQRNIAREIKQLLELNFAKNPTNPAELDPRRKYVLELQGVIPVPKYNSKLMQKMGYSNYKNYKGFKLCFNFFGGCEYNNKKLACDVRHYLKNNAEHIFKDDTLKKRHFLTDIFEQILEAFSFVHDNNVVLRDFKDDNILIRRRFDSTQENKSIYEIQLCDFGMSKKKPDHGNKLMPLRRENSIAYNSINRFRHPRFYKALLEEREIEYQKRDDIFGLGILLFKMYEEYLKLDFDDKIKNFIQYLTGFQFEIVQQYYTNHDILDYKLACEQLLEKDCKNWQECWSNIPDNINQILASETFKIWKEI